MIFAEEITNKDSPIALLLTIFGTDSPFCHFFAFMSQHEDKKKQQLFPSREISPYLCSVKSRQVVS